MKLMRMISRVGRIAGAVVLTVLFLAGAGLGLIQTEAGKRLIARKATDLLQTRLGPGSSVSSISGIIPFNFRVGEARLCDGAGEWLRVENFVFRFSPSQFFRLKARIDELGADRVEWGRLPESDQPGPAGERTGGGLPGSWPRLALDRIFIGELVLGRELAGERTPLTLDGWLETGPLSGLAVKLKLAGTAAPLFSAALEGRAERDLSWLYLDVGLSEEKGGPLSRRLGLAGSGPLAFHLHGEGPGEEFRTELTARIEGVGRVRGALSLDLPAREAEGELGIELDDLGSLPLLAAGGVSGSVRAAVRLTREDGAQNVFLQAESAALAVPPLQADSAKVSVNLKDVLNSPAGEVTLTVAGPGWVGSEGGGVVAGAKSADLHLLLSGPPTAPEINLNLELAGVTSPDLPGDIPSPAVLSLKADLRDNRLDSRAEFSGRPGSRLRYSAVIPLEITLAPPSFNLPLDGGIEGEASLRFDLGLLASLDALTRQSLTGNLTVDCAAGGTLRRPDFSGRLRITDGEYQHLDSGTVLSGLEVEAEADRSRLVVKRFSASGPGEGNLSLDGWMELSPERNYPFSLSLLLSALELVNTDEYWAAASGKTDFAGDLEKMRLSGKIKVERAGFNIPRSVLPEVKEISVVEINKPGGEEVSLPGGPSPILEKIALDLAFNAEDRIAVSGRGLNSTWGVDLSLGGTAASPQITGGLKLIGGYFIFLGKRLDLKNCSVSLDGGASITPQLNINAETNSGGALIILQIVGTPDNPQLRLTSQPSYPPDEILARLLFGAGRASLTAVEGVRIAYGLRVLQGGDDIFDSLTEWTSFLGGPQLDITQFENNPNVSALSARWDLGEDVAVENQKSLTGAGDVVILYLNLTRRLQLMAEAGLGGAGDGARLRWHSDF